LRLTSRGYLQKHEENPLSRVRLLSGEGDLLIEVTGSSASHSQMPSRPWAVHIDVDLYAVEYQAPDALHDLGYCRLLDLDEGDVVKHVDVANHRSRIGAPSGEPFGDIAGADALAAPRIQHEASHAGLG
jgi:hypothetical protein